MEVFRLLQIGDVHYPDEENATRALDDKDPGFPDRVKGLVGLPPLQVVFKGVANALESMKPDALVFMGDYTSRGDAGPLRECLRYLHSVIPDSWAPKLTNSCMMIVGNHDLNRRLDPSGAERWSSINDAIVEAGFPPAPIDHPARLSWTAPSGGKVETFGLNTCAGCGETRRLSFLIRDEVKAKIEATLADPTATIDELNQIVDQLDTPAVSEDAVEEVLVAAGGLGIETAVIVCGHHNLLPQSTPRLAPYTELLNAGSLRESLLGLDRPVLFMHGHLHTDPIEIIRTPGRKNGAIISIAAPIFRDGFNVIEIAFSGTLPLGCRVIPYRRNGNQLVTQADHVVPLWNTGQGLKFAGVASRDLMGQLPTDRAVYRSQVLSDLGWPDGQLDDAIEELRWLGVLEVLNPESPKQLWRVMRAI